MTSFSKIVKARGSRRAQVFMSGLLATSVGAIKVTIRDISESGAHVVGEHAIPTGDRVQLQRGALHAYAHVAWVRGKEAGLSFEKPLSAVELQRCMPTAIIRTLEAKD